MLHFPPGKYINMKSTIATFS